MPFPSSINSLAQLPGLERLTEVCKEFDVEITAFGSVVRRLACHLLRRRESELPDLFQLAPFLSDIDLRHTGKPAQAEAIREAIFSCVPYSECFRWQIFSEDELRPFTEDAEWLPVIPVNKLTLATRSGNGIQDPLDAVQDLRRKRFRLLRKPHYHRSKLWLQKRDCELLHAMFFLQVLSEHAKTDPFMEPVWIQPGWQACREMIRSASEPAEISALMESAYLRARLCYRLKALRSTCQSERLWNNLTVLSGLDAPTPLNMAPVFPNDQWILEMRWLHESEHPRPLVSGCHLGENIFRFSSLKWNPDEMRNPKEEWRLLSEKHEPLHFVSQHPLPELGAGQRPLMVIPPMRFSAGVAPSARGDEHLHLELALSQSDARKCRKLGFGNLGVLAVLSGAQRMSGAERNKERFHSCVVSLPSVCAGRDFKLQNGKKLPLLQMRINFGRLLEVFPGILEKGGLKDISSHALQIFVIADYETPTLSIA